MEILTLLLLLQIKHCYADFMIQTYAQTVRKGIYRDLVGISHTMDHVTATLVALFLFSIWHPVAPLTILWIALLEGIAHYHIDWIKVRYGCKDNTKPVYWAEFGLDQLSHQLCYILIIGYLLV
jgi:hypothetical protein